MPAPTKDQLTKLAQTNFSGLGIKLPVGWAKPGTQFPDAFSVSERIAPPVPPTNLFQQATLNKYHVDAAKDIGEKLAKYIEGICGATCDAIDKWMKATSIATVIINGPVGVLTPGGVVGPPLTPLIMAGAPKKTAAETKYSTAIANAVGSSWQAWQTGLTGMLQYPAFAAFAGPVAPPTPNVPVPLISLSSPGESMLAPAALKGLMVANLGDPDAAHSAELFDAFSKAFNSVFSIFKSSTLVQNVMGMGPIPTFAPPFVPVGPVVGGSVIPKPGVFS